MTKEVTEVKAKEKKPRLTPKQWAEAETLWEMGEATLVSLAGKFKVSEQAIFMHMKRNKIVRGSRANEHKKKVADAVSSAATDDASVTAGRIRETKEDHYKMSAALARMSFNEILQAKQKNLPFATALNNLKALDSAMTILSKARQERWAVLGLDRTDYVDEEGLPELLISELTADQIEELRNRDHTEFDVDEVPLDSDGEDDSDNEVMEE